jgi:hypothetical protein
MSSTAKTIQKDQRLILEGAAPQLLTMPESQLTASPYSVAVGGEKSKAAVAFTFADPLGIAVGDKSTAEVSYGGVTIVNYPAEVNDLVNSILQQTSKVSEQAAGAVGSINETLAGIIEGIKTPLSQYLPYAALGGLLFVLYLLSKR